MDECNHCFNIQVFTQAKDSVKNLCFHFAYTDSCHINALKPESYNYEAKIYIVLSITDTVEMIKLYCKMLLVYIHNAPYFIERFIASKAFVIEGWLWKLFLSCYNSVYEMKASCREHFIFLQISNFKVFFNSCKILQHSFIGD